MKQRKNKLCSIETDIYRREVPSELNKGKESYLHKEMTYWCVTVRLLEHCAVALNQPARRNRRKRGANKEQRLKIKNIVQ